MDLWEPCLFKPPQYQFRLTQTVISDYQFDDPPDLFIAGVQLQWGSGPEEEVWSCPGKQADVI